MYLFDSNYPYDKSKIVIIPVPYDGTSTWGKGADKGPDAIFKASQHLEVYDIETDSEVHEQGIHTAVAINAKSAEKLAQKVEKEVRTHIKKGKFVVCLGGEHSISIGAIAAHDDVTVLQLDAHSDMREEYEGSKHNHACVMARASEKHPVVQVGIRSMAAEERPRVKNVVFARDYSEDSISNIISMLGERVYITIDLDVFDPSIMPSTGTPEPGGLQWYAVLKLLRAVAENRQVVGFDVVELAPTDNKAPDFLAAKLIYKLLSYIFQKK